MFQAAGILLTNLELVYARFRCGGNPTKRYDASTIPVPGGKTSAQFFMNYVRLRCLRHGKEELAVTMKWDLMITPNRLGYYASCTRTRPNRAGRDLDLLRTSCILQS